MTIRELKIYIENCFEKRGWKMRDNNHLCNCVCANISVSKENVFKQEMITHTKEFCYGELVIHPYYFCSDLTEHKKMKGDEFSRYSDIILDKLHSDGNKYIGYIFEHIHPILLEYLRSNKIIYSYVIFHHFAEFNAKEDVSIRTINMELYRYSNNGRIDYISKDSIEYHQYFKEYFAIIEKHKKK